MFIVGVFEVMRDYLATTLIMGILGAFARDIAFPTSALQRSSTTLGSGAENFQI
jgi:hypothetical protein